MFNFLYSTIAFLLAMNALMAGVTLCAIVALIGERRRGELEHIRTLPPWIRKLVKSEG